MTDLILLMKMKNGDKEAFSAFVSKYYDSISIYCQRRCSDSYMVEDFTQETFLHFFEALSTYKYHGKTLNYLYTIAGNLFKNEYKRKKAFLTDDYTILDTPKSFNEDEKIIKQIYCNGLIDQLPKEFKEIILLYYFQNMTLYEISTSLNISLSLVKYRLSRAKVLLKECSENEG